ncbi:hypothetical protein SCHPADRAFT_981253 [Schizopora paradoxa]|uniref:Uncharacterized protein n=1 Tax=Schizopora paradoxa TaxID=27342 RepID=A0A0H2RBL8_9AGAM|nr:hypothetical protein SCHPADRAFT_981253 [Schizopora paradoxa]
MTSLEQLYSALPTAPGWNPTEAEALFAAANTQLVARIRLHPQSIICTIDPPPTGTRHQNIAGATNPRFPSTSAQIITWTLLYKGCVVLPSSQNWSHVYAVPVDLQFRRDFGSDPLEDGIIELEMLTVDSSCAHTHNVYHVSATINIRFSGKHIQYILLAKYGARFSYFLQHVLRG